MEKFIKIPVTNEGHQLVQANDIKLIERASTTSLTVGYGSGKVTTITYTPASAAAAMDVRKTFESAIAAALSTSWTNVAYDWTPGMATAAAALALTTVSGIDIA